MLVLTRKLNESIIIDGEIRVTVVGIRGNHVRLGIEAPDAVAIFREELYERAERDEQPAPTTRDVAVRQHAAGRSA
jgi:carbon storage regulator